ncbi:MAG TPA: NADH-quinone oxidoreductase subunit NuoG [Zeimonas sp.]
MVKLEIDGREVEVPEGSMVMHAANELDIYVPHFCYHKKLSIAANCRMCLVEVEKAPKPLPACATPVSPGMKVFTRSEMALRAQKGVMEFLLINHPLDCPVCDKGGECQLQDLSVGYGYSASQFKERKRVVTPKPMGPLISAREMQRCIHCTRCVRFGIEIGGVQELGMANRGEHSEILSFVGRAVDSELSGNMIDVCPVGALLSKPFRFTARNWELARRKSVSPHDSLGSNLIVQVRGNRVMRVLPLENEAVNECWLSDRDRFSYEALVGDERLEAPMIRQDGEWRVTDWPTALDYASHAIRTVRAEHGAQAIGALGSGQSTVEELHLLARLVRGLGGENVDFRTRQVDFSGDALRDGVPWLGMSVADAESLDRLLLVGSTLRKDHPLFASRVRKAAKAGAQVSIVHAADDDLLMPLANRVVVAPSRWTHVLGEVLAALGDEDEATASAAARESNARPGTQQGDRAPSDAARAIAASLRSGAKRAVLIGNAALHHPDCARIVALACAIAEAASASFGVIGDSANAVGGHLAGAVPRNGGLNAAQMIEQPRSLYLLLNVEPALDVARPAIATDALSNAESVIALTAYRSPELMELADCLLPITPFTETSGTFVNAEGRVQSFNGVTPPLADSRPAWKVLRVLGSLLEVEGFDVDSPEQVRKAALAGDIAAQLNNSLRAAPDAGASAAAAPATDGALERLAEVPIYAADPIVRRAPSLQLTNDALLAARARMNAATIARLGLAPGEQVLLRQARGERSGEAVLELVVDDALADGVVRVPAAVPETASLPEGFGPIHVERFAPGRSR